jgi:hypothetical protein
MTHGQGFTVKKSTLKLAIRRETLRTLAQLDLARVAGGEPDVPQLDTVNPETGCPYQAAALSAKP